MRGFPRRCNNICFTTTNAGRVGWICDRSNFLLRKVVRDTAVVTTVAGTGSAGYANGIGLSASFNGHDGLKTINDRCLIYAESASNMIRRIDIYGENYDRIVVSHALGYNNAGSAAGYGGAARATHTLGVLYVPRLARIFFTSNYGPGWGVDGGGTLDAFDWTP